MRLARSGHDAATAERVALSVLTVDLPDSDPGSRAQVAAQVPAALAALPDTTAIGVRAAAALVGVALVGVAAEDASGTVARLRGSRLPGVAEYLKLVRSLALVAWFEEHQP